MEAQIPIIQPVYTSWGNLLEILNQWIKTLVSHLSQIGIQQSLIIKPLPTPCSKGEAKEANKLEA